MLTCIDAEYARVVNLTPCTSTGIHEHKNSVLTAQWHWATTGSQKGALGASRAARKAAIDAALVSFAAPAERAQTERADPSQVRDFGLGVGAQELFSRHPLLWQPARQVAYPLIKAQHHAGAHLQKRNWRSASG